MRKRPQTAYADIAAVVRRKYFSKSEMGERPRKPLNYGVCKDYKLICSGPLYSFGKDAPHFTIPSSRPQTSMAERSPGPAYYSPEVKEKRLKTAITEGRGAFLLT